MGEHTQAGGGVVEGASVEFGPVTPVMVGHLRDTKPWVRLASIMGFMGSALMFVAGIVVPFVGALSHELGGAIGGIAIGLLYLLLGCFYFFPSLFLFRYASAIRSMLTAKDTRSMELALSYQMRFWRLVGIATLAMLCIYGVAFVVIVLFGILAALK